MELFIGLLFGLVTYDEIVSCTEPAEKEMDRENLVPTVYPIRAELTVPTSSGGVDRRNARRAVTLWYPCRGASFALCDWALRSVQLHRDSKASEYKRHGHQNWKQMSARLRRVYATHMEPVYVLSP